MVPSPSVSRSMPNRFAVRCNSVDVSGVNDQGSWEIAVATPAGARALGRTTLADTECVAPAKKKPAVEVQEAEEVAVVPPLATVIVPDTVFGGSFAIPRYPRPA